MSTLHRAGRIFPPLSAFLKVNLFLAVEKINQKSEMNLLSSSNFHLEGGFPIELFKKFPALFDVSNISQLLRRSSSVLVRSFWSACLKTSDKKCFHEKLINLN